MEKMLIEWKINYFWNCLKVKGHVNVSLTKLYIAIEIQISPNRLQSCVRAVYTSFTIWWTVDFKRRNMYVVSRIDWDVAK